MSLQSLATWLRCPHCSEPVAAQPPLMLRCAHGHSFDVNKRGYVNMVPPGNRMIGDSPAMLDARAAFLESGHFSPVLTALAAAAVDGGAGARAGVDVLDAGCGTGYYLAGVLAAHERAHVPARALAMDISAHAVARAVRTAAHVDGLVADVWRPLPIRDGAADIIMTVFAPRNLGEFHRVLRPAGRLLVVVPSEHHIQELRVAGQAIGIPGEKASRLAHDAAGLFDTAACTRIEYAAQLSPAEIRDLLGMGPSAHHRPEGGRETGRADAGTAAPRAVTVSVDLLVLHAR